MASKLETYRPNKPHAGRRGKLRARLLDEGMLAFTQSEVLELALTFAIPRVDTNPTAHRLLEIFGTLSSVLDAHPSDLVRAAGVGENAAVFLNFLHELNTYLAMHRIKRYRIITPANAESMLLPLLRSFSTEQFVIVCLDHADHVMKVGMVSTEQVGEVNLNVREIIHLITAHHADKVILAHNHLSESPLPSLADMRLTRQLIIILKLMNVQFVDHLISTDTEHYSFACGELLEQLKEEVKILGM